MKSTLKSNKANKEHITIKGEEKIQESKKNVAKKSSSKSEKRKTVTKIDPNNTITSKVELSKDNPEKQEDKKVIPVKDIISKEVVTKVKNAKESLKAGIEDITKEINNKTITTKKTSSTGKTTKKSASKKSSVSTSKKSSKTESATKSKTRKTKSTAKKVSKTDITSFNTYLFHQGKNYEAYNILGSHIKTEKRKKGAQFTTWAPNAKEVYVVGDFNNFEVEDQYKLEKITENGLWTAFFAGIKAGTKYKYCIVGQDGKRGEYKADPYAIQTEMRPNNASIVYEPENFKWNDKTWLNNKSKTNALEEPMNIYEVHLGSWKRNEDGEFLTYDEISEQLPEYVKEMGYTHVEFMPIIEHPLDASWGYQGTGYYSPTSRYGKLEGLKKLINKLHVMGIGVILDWAPGHFCKDAHGLYKFDGSPVYEYQEEWRAENKGWGTCNFDLGRPEVKSYLISNALYWYREFHIDGLRVDAVSSILYLDYSRNFGEWAPNKYGGNGNLEAIEFLKELNNAVFAEYPTALMIAEESTSWPNITKSTTEDGLGFNFKWNMGWMNDTLEYVQIDPIYRKNNHKNITFSMMYNYAENYILPISHDEVVHGKKSLVNKMWGDEWNKFAGLRTFMGYMMGHPSKKILFMGCEFAQSIEWREYESLQWNTIEEFKIHKQTHIFFKELNKFYLENKALWELDHDPEGFKWIEPDNAEQSVLIFTRRSRNDDETLIFVINFTPTVYYDYQIGVPFLGEYKEAFNTDDSKYGGSGQVMDTVLLSEKIPFQKQPYSIKIKVPPMATLILKVNEIEKEKNDIEENLEVKEIEENSNQN